LVSVWQSPSEQVEQQHRPRDGRHRGGQQEAAVDGLVVALEFRLMGSRRYLVLRTSTARTESKVWSLKGPEPTGCTENSRP
jgi:hypothetical protein